MCEEPPIPSEHMDTEDTSQGSAIPIEKPSQRDTQEMSYTPPKPRTSYVTYTDLTPFSSDGAAYNLPLRSTLLPFYQNSTTISDFPLTPTSILNPCTLSRMSLPSSCTSILRYRHAPGEQLDSARESMACAVGVGVCDIAVRMMESAPRGLRGIVCWL
jgi:hypothetical protein